MTEREILNYIFENAVRDADEIREISYMISDSEKRKVLNEKYDDCLAFANAAKSELEELEYEVSEEISDYDREKLSLNCLCDNAETCLREIGKQYGIYRNGEYRKEVAGLIEAAMDFLADSLENYEKIM